MCTSHSRCHERGASGWSWPARGVPRRAGSASVAPPVPRCQRADPPADRPGQRPALRAAMLVAATSTPIATCCRHSGQLVGHARQSDAYLGLATLARIRSRPCFMTDPPRGGRSNPSRRSAANRGHPSARARRGQRRPERFVQGALAARQPAPRGRLAG
jgi:hypothetical protein